MSHHKRRRPKNRRAGCLFCKPHKANGAKSVDPPAAKRRMQDEVAVVSESKEWTHVTAVEDGEGASIYVNGADVVSRATANERARCLAEIEALRAKWREDYEDGDLKTIVVGELGRVAARIKTGL